MPENKSVFETLSAIDMGHAIKQNFSKQPYIPWGEQWHELAKHYPDATFKVRTNSDGMPFFASQAGVFVCVEVTVSGITREQWHTCLDAKNKAITAPDSREINKAIQRALAKCVALHGLGMYLYKGDDYPDLESAHNPKANLATGEQSDQFYDLCQATNTDIANVLGHFCANVFKCKQVLNFEQLSEQQAQQIINGLIAKRDRANG